MDKTVITNRELFLMLQKSMFFFDKMADQVLKKETDISLAQFHVLMLIFMHTSTTQQAISSMMQNTQASVSRQVTILLGKKYITRIQNPKNRREYTLTSTPAGSVLVKKATRSLDTKFKEVFGIVSEKEKEKVIQIFSKIIQRVGTKLSNSNNSDVEIEKTRECLREGLKKLSLQS